jgi:hypothetical protein
MSTNSSETIVLAPHAGPSVLAAAGVGVAAIGGLGVGAVVAGANVAKWAHGELIAGANAAEFKRRIEEGIAREYTLTDPLEHAEALRGIIAREPLLEALAQSLPVAELSPAYISIRPQWQGLSLKDADSLLVDARENPGSRQSASSADASGRELARIIHESTSRVVIAQQVLVGQVLQDHLADCGFETSLVSNGAHTALWARGSGRVVAVLLDEDGEMNVDISGHDETCTGVLAGIRGALQEAGLLDPDSAHEPDGNQGALIRLGGKIGRRSSERAAEALLEHRSEGQVTETTPGGSKSTNDVQRRRQGTAWFAGRSQAR